MKEAAGEVGRGGSGEGGVEREREEESERLALVSHPLLVRAPALSDKGSILMTSHLNYLFKDPHLQIESHGL